MVINLRVPFGVGSAWVPEKRKKLVYNYMSAESIIEGMAIAELQLQQTDFWILG